MATLYPKQVEINEANINKLRDTLKSSYKQIVQEMKTATDFGVKERKAILAQIESILESTGEDVAKFIEKELPTYYKQGATQATQQLGNVGADISVKTGFNRVHKETIMAMIDDTTTAFGESLTGIKRSANNLLGKATRDMLTQEMAKGVTAGDALRNVKNAMLQRLEDEGLSALIDKSGKTWSLDAYTEMLFRTKAVEARNRGLVNRVAENGYDLVQVSSHQGTCDACARWEGSILSVSGETDGYETVSDAEADGLFHPNAVLDGSTFSPYGELEEMVRANYEGPAITFCTAEGYTLTIGPNHPILTDRGFVRAKVINKDHKLIYDARVVTTNSVIGSNFENMPMVENAFESLLLMGGDIAKVATTGHDFHGDAVFCKGEINVVYPTSGLLSVLNPVGIEQFRDDHFMPSDMQLLNHSGVGPLGLGSDAVNLSAPCTMGFELSRFYRYLHITSIVHNPCYKGKAYDATTKSGIYNSNGFVVSNCRHAINILIPKLANMSDAYNEDEETKKLPEDVQKPNKAQTFTVFRGEGNKENPARGFDSYGKGKYYSLDKKYAEYFGAVKESEIVLRNPLEIRSQDGLSKATARMVEKGFQDMGEWAKSEGYDGIIDYETGIILKPKN